MSENKPDPKAADDKGERIAKRLARAGVCSRRDAERWIAEGRVVVNGQRLDTPAFLVQPADLIVVDGKPIAEPERTRVWRYHKPAGLMTTHKDPEGRPTVFERMPEGMPRVISVGRLDYASEGLLLLTNDGELARKLELPSNSWIRRYRVRVHGEVDPVRLLELEKGITVDGVRYGEIKALLDRQKGANAWVTVSIREGKNREVRRVFDHLGWPVLRLIRVAYGPFQLGNLGEGEVEEIPAKVFKEQLGLEDSKWAKAAADERPQLPHAPGARKGGRTRTEGGKERPFQAPEGGKGRPVQASEGGKGRPGARDTTKKAGTHADRRRKP
ncbi:MAG TPA: pseudouridine synthase [Magnetospirillum sp.]|nr:pseudouridine synthase [Magnetospirillum sp.]